ncbi:hypothetical protein KM1_143140 [Entamoeba histolytica HM-3:IMSS]|uniref:Uncharacterized protein n=1 Tax=Entamoeba histolytica HM-3:IMSS TaxID=885315 RepID=M7WFY6_ENTHI|nr:hypothetical protein KM1_143140 [Entamoeba histolytica HM-3:IMSS]
MSISVFKPCRKEMYSIVYGKSTNLNLTVCPSPMSKTVVIQSPSPMDFKKSTIPVPRVSRLKKKWNNELKRVAVTKAKEIGLTKATRFLQLNYPTEFGELSPSTLQYWIQKCA